MARKYLDDNGLGTLWGIIKNALGSKLDTNGDAYRTLSIPFGEVDSTSTSKIFKATIPGITELRDGVCILLRNGVVTSASSCTLNINELGAKPMYVSNAATTRITTGFNINYTYLFIYDSSRVSGGCWVAYYGYDGNSNTVPSAQCETAAATAAKTATCTNFTLKTNSFLFVNIRYSNTKNTALTLNVNSTGAKSIYINGTASSSSNYTLPAGTYIAFYDDTNYYFRTDDKLTADITGDAGTVNGHTVEANVPSDAVFTDTVTTATTTGDGNAVTSVSASNGALTITKGATFLTQHQDISGKVNKTGDTMTGQLTVPILKTGYTVTNVANYLYGGTAKETVIYTGIKYVSSAHMPVVRLKGYCYGLGQTTEICIGLYIYQNEFYSSRTATNLGAWKPDIYLFTYEKNSVTYVAIGLSGQVYYNMFSVDVQDEKGKFDNIDIDGWDIIGYTSTGQIPDIGTDHCVSVQYKSDIQNPPKVNNHTVNSDVPADAVFTDTTYESKTAAENGTALSLVTTGEKYLWNNAASGTGSASWDSISGKPTETGESTTGISIGNHATGTVIGVQSSTTSVTGVQSSTTTASKVTLGTALSIPNVTGASDVTVPKAASSATTVPIKNAFATSIPNVTDVGSASNWVFENVTVPIKASSATTVPIAASSATTVPIKDASATTIPNVTDAGSGSASLTFTMDSTDTKKLIINFSHTHTPPTIGTPISVTGVQSTTTSVTGVNGSTSVTGVQSSTTTASHVKSGGNGTAPTLGTAISIYGVQSTTTSVTGVSGSTTASKVTLGTAIDVPNVTNVSDVTVPIKATSATTVPIKNTSASTFVTGTTHTITDNGHTHSIS